MLKNRTILLLLANILLAVFIFYNSDEEYSTAINLNSKFSEMISKMVEIEISNPVISQKIIIRKDDMAWSVHHPISWSAEPVAIANLISKLSHLNPTFIHFLDELEDKGEIPQDYGIDENSSKMLFRGENNEFKITLGKMTRDSTGRYFLFSEEKSQSIWHAPQQIAELVNQPLNDWTKLTFLNFPLYTIDELEVIEWQDSNSTSKVSLSKQNDRWYLKSPFNLPANDEQVGFLLHKLISSRISGFAEENELTEKARILDLKVRASGQWSHLIISRVNTIDQLHIKNTTTNQAFYVTNDFLSNFTNLELNLREKRVFNLQMSEIKRIKIHDNNRSITLRKNDQNSWNGLEDNGSDSFSFISDLERVRDLVDDLNTVKVTSFVLFNPNAQVLREQGLDRPRFRLEVEQQDSTSHSILISKSNSDSSYWNTYIAEQALICLVNKPWDKFLSVDAIDYQDRNLLPVDFTPNNVVLKSISENKVMATFSQETNGEAFERILQFKAEYFLQHSFDPEGVWVDGDWLPWEYSLSFESSALPETAPLTFNLTERSGGIRWFVGSEDLGFVANLSIQVIDELGKYQVPKFSEP